MRLDSQKQAELEPKRLLFAKNVITHLGYEIIEETPQFIRFEFKGHMVTHYAYSGWHTGKSINDGRGIEKLLKQIKP